jgi:hypothetical protein
MPAPHESGSLDRTLSEIGRLALPDIDMFDGAAGAVASASGGPGQIKASKVVGSVASQGISGVEKLYGPSGTPMPEAVKQGDLPDCYFLASVLATARQQPHLIQKLISENSDGTYTVTWNRPGIASITGISGATLEVTDKDGSRAGVGGTQNGIYVQVLESAAAKQFGQNFTIVGGQGMTPLALLTGSADINNYKDLSDDGLGYRRIGALNAKGFKFDPKVQGAEPLTTNLRSKYDINKLHDDFKNGAVIVAATGTSVADNMATKLVPNHMFAVTNVNIKQNTVEVTNPWNKFNYFQDTNPFSSLTGVTTAGRKPRVLTMPAKDFFSNFPQLTVARKK